MLPWGPCLEPEEKRLLAFWLSREPPPWRWDRHGRLYRRIAPGLAYITPFLKLWWFLEIQLDTNESLYERLIIFKWSPLGLRIGKIVRGAGPPPPPEPDGLPYATV